MGTFLACRHWPVNIAGFWQVHCRCFAYMCSERCSSVCAVAAYALCSGSVDEAEGLFHEGLNNKLQMFCLYV